MTRVAGALFDFVNMEAENMRELCGVMPNLAAWEQASPFAGALTELVDKIGERATVPVLAQHLKIEGHRETAEVTEAEALALEVVAVALQGLKRMADAIAAEKAKEPAPAPRPVPIDETTMETIDDPMDTWGGSFAS